VITGLGTGGSVGKRSGVSVGIGTVGAIVAIGSAVGGISACLGAALHPARITTAKAKAQNDILDKLFIFSPVITSPYIFCYSLLNNNKNTSSLQPACNIMMKYIRIFRVIGDGFGRYVIINFNNSIAHCGTLIQRGGGTGPKMPRQPGSVKAFPSVPNPAEKKSGR